MGRKVDNPLEERRGGLSLPLASWVTLGKPCYYSVPQFPHLGNGTKNRT